MAKTRRGSKAASDQRPHTVRPLYLILLILGLIAAVVAFMLIPDPGLRVICLATIAWLVWQVLRAIGWL